MHPPNTPSPWAQMQPRICSRQLLVIGHHWLERENALLSIPELQLQWKRWGGFYWNPYSKHILLSNRKGEKEPHFLTNLVESHWKSPHKLQNDSKVPFYPFEMEDLVFGSCKPAAHSQYFMGMAIHCSLNTRRVNRGEYLMHSGVCFLHGTLRLVKSGGNYNLQKFNSVSQ